MTSEEQSAVALSVIIPVYNGERIIASTMRTLHEYLLTTPSEIIVVENGSTDKTYEVACEQAQALHSDSIQLQVLQSDKGLGNALRRGIQASSGARILLTADDLPFGLDDLEEDAKLASPKPDIVIGSKAHPDSRAGRSTIRSVSTTGFRILRSILLRSKVGDSQGTIIANGPWLRAMLEKFDDSGFLFGTQVVYAAEQQGLQIQEVPVTLRLDEGPDETTVRITDVVTMGSGLVRMRIRRKDFADEPYGAH